MITKYLSIVGVTIWLLLPSNLFAQNASPIVVKVDQPIADIQPTMWGIFFEDINFAADGGLYAELIKNRSFEFFNPLMGWKELKPEIMAGSILIVNREETNPSNPRFAHIAMDDSKGGYGLSNEGFRGIGIKKDNTYHFSIMASQGQNSNLKLRIELVSAKGDILGNATLSPEGIAWKKYTVSFSALNTDPKANLHIWFEGKGTLDIDMISLFPNDTWKNRPNGLRADLVQLLADMKPGFLRFPGGCIVEGRELATRYQWKKTVGDINDRKTIVNRWNTEFNHRPTPDYFQTFGLGFFEYFQLCEDIGAEPLPILSCGMACQFNTAEVVPMDELNPYIQDALDLIEFANGTVDTKWGKLRTEMGHPAPFNLKLLGVGNEQWGSQYIERYKVFAGILKEKYPEIKLISDPGPAPTGEMFDYLWTELRKLHADIVDEHYYKSPSWFQENATRYDNYDRKGPKVFAGEYAVQSVAIASPDNKNNWDGALSEAAYMTGLERNADVVIMASYAPLFAHSEGWQWTPDLIWFDNLRSMGTPNYYVQKMFSTNRGSQIIPALIENKPVTGQNKLYVSAVWDKNANEIILKIVNTGDKAQEKEINLEGIKKINPLAKLMVLKSSDLNELNSLDNPKQISPNESTLKIAGKKFKLSVDPYSFIILKIQTQ